MSIMFSSYYQYCLISDYSSPVCSEILESRDSIGEGYRTQIDSLGSPSAFEYNLFLYTFDKVDHQQYARVAWVARLREAIEGINHWF